MAIKFKLITRITNSGVEESQKTLLKNYINTLPDSDLAKLITIFEQEPRAVAIYADYIKALQQESEPISAEKSERILTSLLNSLS